MSELHTAASNNDVASAITILDQSPELVAKTDKLSRTPLHLAAFRGSLDVAELLLSYDAKADALANDQVTPLHFAVLKGNVEMAKLLLKHGAKVNRQMAKQRLTPLMTAVKQGNEKMIRLLRYAGASAKLKDKAGKTVWDLQPKGAIASSLDQRFFRREGTKGINLDDFLSIPDVEEKKEEESAPGIYTKRKLGDSSVESIAESTSNDGKVGGEEKRRRVETESDQ